MPSFLMRNWRVERFSPSRLAAPVRSGKDPSSSRQSCQNVCPAEFKLSIQHVLAEAAKMAPRQNQELAVVL
jgi:hypothetical protein